MYVAPEVRKRLIQIGKKGIAFGLSDGPVPGELCIQAAICAAMGEKHGDEPTCVEQPDNRISIAVNDLNWGTNRTRAKYLLPIGLAQLGTKGEDRLPWLKRVVLGIISLFAADMLKDNGKSWTKEEVAAVKAIIASPEKINTICNEYGKKYGAGGYHPTSPVNDIHVSCGSWLEDIEALESKKEQNKAGYINKKRDHIYTTSVDLGQTIETVFDKAPLRRKVAQIILAAYEAEGRA